MELARLILWLFVGLNLMVSGALIFNRSRITFKFLGAFCLTYAIEQVDFLYSTGPLLEISPIFFMLLFPVCLLSGPLIWLHIKSFIEKKEFSFRSIWLHFVPFMIYLVFTIYLLSFGSSDRQEYVSKIYQTLIIPLNYFKVFHVFLYASLSILTLSRNLKWLEWNEKQYLFTIVLIYFSTAVLLTYLTALQYPYEYFITYFMMSGLIILASGYLLRFQPNLLLEIKTKYFNSGLTDVDFQRIASKIDAYFLETANVLDQKLNLEKLSMQIQEKKQHVSQSITEIYDSNFSDLVNCRKIAHAMTLLSAPENKDLKIYAIMLDSGFKSKTTFYRVFVKHAGCTPAEYRKRIVPNN